MGVAKKLLAALVVVAFGMVLGLGLLLPLYTDEVVSSVQRGLADGGGQLSILGPLCRGVFTQKIGLTAYPGALFYRIFFEPHGLLGLRVRSVVVVAIWFAATWRVSRGRGFASFVALHAFGLVPLAIISARGEPMMLVCFGAVAALALGRPARNGRARAWRAALLVLLTSIVFATHPRALFYAPFLLAGSVLAFGRRGRGWAVVVVAIVGLTTAQAYGLAKDATACPNGPRTEAILRSISSPPTALVRSPSLALRNIVRFGEIMSASMSFVPEPDRYQWIPNDAATWLTPTTVHAADRLTHVALIALYAGMPAFVLVGLWRARRRPRVRSRAVLATLLLVGGGTTVVINNVPAFYNIAGVMPVFALACFLVAPAFDGVWHGWRVGAVALQLAAVLSLVATIANVGPRLVALAGRDGVIYPDRPATLPTMNASAERVKIRAHAKTCGITGDGATRLVVDDETLFAFDDLREPIHVIYVTDDAMWGSDYPGKKDVELLERLGASGLIARCRYLPTALAPRAQRNGDYCCLGRITE